MAEKVKVSCFHCGITNYYPLDSERKKVVCGRCKNVLPMPGTVVEPPPAEAYNIFQKSALPILIDFHSPTCAPCLIMHPVVESLAKRRAGELMVVKVNTDQHPEMGAAFGVQGIPTFIILHKGTEVGRTTGALSEPDFVLWVASIV